MRNNDFLDNPMPEDALISAPYIKDGRLMRTVNGVAVKQIDEITQADKDHNLICNRVRASGMSAWEFLNLKR